METIINPRFTNYNINDFNIMQVLPTSNHSNRAFNRRYSLPGEDFDQGR